MRPIWSRPDAQHRERPGIRASLPVGECLRLGESCVVSTLLPRLQLRCAAPQQHVDFVIVPPHTAIRYSKAQHKPAGQMRIDRGTGVERGLKDGDRDAPFAHSPVRIRARRAVNTGVHSLWDRNESWHSPSDSGGPRRHASRNDTAHMGREQAGVAPAPASPDSPRLLPVRILSRMVDAGAALTCAAAVIDRRSFSPNVYRHCWPTGATSIRCVACFDS